MAHPSPLPKAELDEFLRSHPAWKVEKGRLVRVFENATFRDAIRFVNEVARLSEAHDHHPDIDIRWKTVTVRLITHDGGDTLTARDTTLARDCELCFESHRAQPAPRSRKRQVP